MCAEELAAHTLRVRPGERRDMAGILAILAEAPEAAAWSPAAVDEALGCAGGLFFVAEIPRQLAGFAVARFITDEGEILNFAVKKAFRRRGIGRRLIEKLLARLRDEGANKVFLEVRESNAAAIAFYRQWGFHEVGRRAAYYQQPDEAAVVMQAELRRKPVPKLDLP
jgi:ribosomal-protein-alanine N-acetyltransferase